jgi:hypothetical protein
MTAISELEHKTPFEFKKVLIESTHFTSHKKVDIRNAVTDLDVFEHLDKPYLTGTLSFIDSGDVITSGYLQGGEKVHVELIVTDDLDAKVIAKTFYITQVLFSQKGHDTVENVVVHLIEDIAYESNMINVNRQYSGKPSKIIGSISDLINKKVSSTDTDKQEMRVIVPNLTPMESISWIKNNSSTKEGYPFYLYSSLIGDELIFSDLKTLMEQDVINPDVPFAHIQANIPQGNDNESKIRRRTILGYQFKNTDNLFKMISEGIVGGEYSFLDITKNERVSGIFDIDKDFTQKIKNDKLISNTSDALDYFRKSELNTKKSRKITQIGSTDAYEGFNSLSQSDDFANYKLSVINKSMDHVLKKSPLTISVNFIEFMKGRRNNSIGKKIRLRFLANINTEDGNDTTSIDMKKSGDFLIFGVKHAFRAENYVATLTCVKLSDEKVTNQ